MDEKAMVKLDADGEIIQCAKGLDLSECGYEPGAKACGKCGAIASSVKAGYMWGTDEDDEDAMPMAPVRKKKSPETMVEDYMAMGEELDDEDMDEDAYVKAILEAMAEEDEEDEDEDEDEEKMYGMMAPKKKKRMLEEDEYEEEMDDESMDAESDEDEDEEVDMIAMRKKMRMRRMNSMGYKSADFDEEAFMCAFERKVHPGGSSVCDNCPGGCVSEGSMPGLLEIEGIAEDMFSGKVLDSGFSDKADLFVVDIERKDGRPVEAFFDGETGECLGWQLLNQDVLQVKSALEGNKMIGFEEAADIATKSVMGDVVAIEPDIFEGYDSYAVEIEGIDGKSYDVFVSLSGEILGYDEYTQEEASEIEAEAAEIALKRAYSEESRMSMAKQGNALPDGSYPIKDEADLRNAIQAYGRAKDKEAAKAHIMKRAMSLGLDELIPSNWVPEDVKKRFSDGEKSEESNFIASLMEFEMLATEHGINETEK